MAHMGLYSGCSTGVLDIRAYIRVLEKAEAFRV